LANTRWAFSAFRFVCHCEISLLTGDLALIELEVVEIGVVGFDALEEEVASLLKERVDGEVEAVN
jgi:hypothetical protein